MLLVCDRESELPLGGTVSPHLPSDQEVYLALYQAIWHPGRESWPLHGIPETLQVPQGLAVNGLQNLHKTASYLLMKITTHLKQPQNGLKQIKEMITSIQREAIPYFMETVPPDQQTGGTIMDTVLTWLERRCFPDHTPAPVWETVRRHGVLMPGHDTPAAGWLLPVVGEAKMTEKGIMYDGEYYRNLYLHKVEPTLFVRHYPYYYPHRGNGIFVQIGTDPTVHVQYMHWQP